MSTLRARFVVAAALVLAAILSACPASATTTTAHRLPSTALTAVSFSSPLTGYGYFIRRSGTGCAGLVARTSDGGSRFTRARLVHSWSCAGGVPWQMRLASNGRGDVFLYGPVTFASHDGSKTWSRLRTAAPVAAISALGRSVWLLKQTCHRGRLALSCRIHLLLSADGGRSWRAPGAQPHPSAFGSSGGQSNWLVRTSRLSGYVLVPPAWPASPSSKRPPAVLMRTRDGGDTWRREQIACPVAMSISLAAVPGWGALAAICAGQPGGAAGPHQAKAVAVSDNGGRTWTLRTPCPLNLNRGLRCLFDWGYLSQIAAPRRSTIFMVGHALSLEVSTNGGRNWHVVKPPLGGPGSDTSQVMFFSASDGIVLGLDQSANETPAIWHTSDGGAQWTEDLPVIG